jgi:phospholipid/cholesterol/gamma-HCH transport system substrate-binding protein
MNATIDLISATITDVKGGVEETLTALSATAVDAQTLMKDLGGEVRTITASALKVGQDLQAIVAGVRQGRGTLGKVMNDETLYIKVRNIADEAERAVANLRAASEDARSSIAELKGDKGPVKAVAGDLQQTLASVREVLEDLSESSEALKRNFFFRGFFNRRGFFDLDNVSVDEYRQGSLETKDRQVLRIWVKSDVLFEKDATGRERLTDDGRNRLDSAMATFLRYPRDTPFVVEGYGGGITTDERYVRSRVRAELVRSYLQGRYGLDPAYVGVMPLGTDAPGSPDNGHWDGIALAAFVRTSQQR